MATRTLNTDSTPPENDPGIPCDEAVVPPLTPAQLAHAFGRRLRALRKERSLSQEELGWRAGTCRTWISHIECGTACPTIASLYRLALALGVPLAALCPSVVPGEDEPDTPGGSPSPSSG